MLLVKTKFNSKEELIFMALNNSRIIHDKFVLVNKVLRECDDNKEVIKNLKS